VVLKSEFYPPSFMVVYVTEIVIEDFIKILAFVVVVVFDQIQVLVS
jgi:hypothetical protein